MTSADRKSSRRCGELMSVKANSMACLLLSALVLTLFTTPASGQVMSACFNTTKSLDIQCGAGSMVRILKAFYGYSPWGQCRYSPGDCTLAEHEDYPCVGRESCSINLPTGTFGSQIPSCQQYSNYFQVEYLCVPAAQTYDICQHSELTAPSGYISTPRYPNNYHSENLCKVTILAQRYQKIRLTIIDMDLERQGRSDCADWMYLNDGFHSITVCGRRANDSYTSMGYTYEVQLKSSANTQSKGFWLYYETDPPLTTTTKAPTTPYPTQPRPSPADNRPPSILSQTLLPTTSTPIPILRDYVTPQNKTSLPFAAIAGGVIGTLSVVLIVLLILLLIKWLRERRYFCDKDQFLEIRNPAFRISGNFQNCPSEDNYYHC